MAIVRMHPENAETLANAYETAANTVDDAIPSLSPLVTEALALLDMPGQNGLYGPIPALLTTKTELTKDERDLAWRIDWIKSKDALPLGVTGRVQAYAPTTGGPNGGFDLDAALAASGLTVEEQQRAKTAIERGKDFTDAINDEKERRFNDQMAAFRRTEAEAWGENDVELTPIEAAEASLDEIRDILDTAKQDRGDGVGSEDGDGVWSTNDLKAMVENKDGYYTPEQVEHAERVLAMVESSPDARDHLGITESGGGWSWSDIGHITLDVLGMVPVVGNAADGINAAWYLAEGEYLDAALSSMALIPGIGQAVTLAKSSVKAALRHVPFNSLDEALIEVRRWLENAGILKRGADDTLEIGEEAMDASSRPRQTGAGSSMDEADAAYDAIRASTGDIDAIARNTDFSSTEIADIKKHVFEQEHLLDRYVDQGEPAVWARFDSDAGIADAWKRLENGTHTPDDIQLLNHELTELRYMQETGNPSYSQAHDYAESIHPSPL